MYTPQTRISHWEKQQDLVFHWFHQHIHCGWQFIPQPIVIPCRPCKPQKQPTELGSKHWNKLCYLYFPFLPHYFFFTVSPASMSNWNCTLSQICISRPELLPELFCVSSFEHKQKPVALNCPIPTEYNRTRRGSYFFFSLVSYIFSLKSMLQKVRWVSYLSPPPLTW